MIAGLVVVVIFLEFIFFFRVFRVEVCEEGVPLGRCLEETVVEGLGMVAGCGLFWDRPFVEVVGESSEILVRFVGEVDDVFFVNMFRGETLFGGVEGESRLVDIFCEVCSIDFEVVDALCFFGLCEDCDFLEVPLGLVGHEKTEICAFCLEFLGDVTEICRIFDGGFLASFDGAVKVAR